ncbi:MAG TPA: pullulanase-type alpha-1,6-glucosidase [Roseiflexaceae bacterium]|nr:pullulanase-type alpha-1,6-glucosidase [Roseiflexaceae bacterium]
MSAHRWKRTVALLPLLALMLALVPQQPASADHTANPTSVTIAGSLQQEVGCPGDWQPNTTECDLTALTYDANDDLWQRSLTIPAGSYEYKAALNNGWNENYGKNAASGGANVPITVPLTQAVKFYYDHKSHWVTDNINSTIATGVGSFQSEIGCTGDLLPDCLRSWMQDIDGDGIYTFETTQIPVGTYDFKVAINESLDENYGLNGELNGASIGFTVSRPNQPLFFSFNAATKEIVIGLNGAPKGNLNQAQAHWVRPDTLLVKPSLALTGTAVLNYSDSADMTLTPAGIVASDIQTVTLTPDPAWNDAAVKAQFPHLQSGNAYYQALKIGAADLAKVPAILKSQFAVQIFDAGGALIDATGIQIPGVLDSLFTYNGALGVSYSGGVPTLRLWAPTARDVDLLLFEDATTTVSTTIQLAYDASTGVWSTTGDASWTGKYYLYDVQVFTPATGGGGDIVRNFVTDPYSISLARNSTSSQIVNLDDPALKPAGWDQLRKPAVPAPEDIVLYELHGRDFSVRDEGVPEEERGTFKAFARSESNGMRHLRDLARAGLTHLHLLPAFDCASIDEDESFWLPPDESILATLPPTSTVQQETIKDIRDQDGFNWCYDPFHYTVPEGSYSTDADGTARILEFRQMVQALNRVGLRVVMDVVYNHTAQSGQGDKSVLDKVVPGYYHRLNLDGGVETSTCCQNTATEHAMMEKLMVDSLVTWTTAYKVDGYRFDLMGHHMLSNMVKVRDTLRALTPQQHGVDGSQIYIYGEGWNFGEVADNARGVNATQLNLAGSGIGSFNDRIRDGSRGGGPFDNGQDMKKQGFLTGLFTDPNDLDQGTPAQQKERLLLFQDQIRVGLAGNLKDYLFTDRTGAAVTGAQVDYNGSPTGYTSDPQEVINYNEAHDNLTLFDGIQLKAPATATITDRVRMQALGIDLIALGQGVPFFHAGQDILRSKSFDGNSYNSGDWFNKLDWTYTTNNFGVGLPIDQESNWPVFTPLLANRALWPSSALIQSSKTHFEEMLRIRKSSPLFRLRTAAEIQAQVAFLNTGPEQTPGLIVMVLTETRAIHPLNPYKRIVVVFNANPTTQTWSDLSFQTAAMRLHPIQQASADPLVRQASFTGASGTFSVPPRTTAVFVQTEQQLALPVVRR